MNNPRCNRVKRYHLTVLAIVLLLGGCAFPQFPIFLTPGSLILLPGDSATVTVSAGEQECDPIGLPPPCIDISGFVFDYILYSVPAGVSYSIDTRLQSPATPDVVRITFDVGNAEPGEYHVLVQAVLSGHKIGRAVLALRILPSTVNPSIGAPATIAASNSFINPYSLAALSDGTLLSWGNNDEGQLGIGSRTTHTTPQSVFLPDNVQALAAAPGGTHALALAAGSVWAWGSNREGRLGTGDRIDRLEPVQVPGLSDIQAIDAGSFFSMALKSDGTVVWTWGRDPGTFDEELSPVPVPDLDGVQGIAAGSAHALALKSDGSVWAWGRNGDGQLGTGTTENESSPVPVAGLDNIVSVAAGSDHSLALAADGSVWAWGRNRDGQLGTGTTENESSPVRVADLDNILSVAAGSDHSLALAADGSVWAWGDNTYGQLGDGNKGSDFNRAAPIQVAELSDVVTIAAGIDHSLALVDCDQLWAWGDNTYGQLGDGTRTEYVTPVPVPGFGNDQDCARVALRVSKVGDGGGTISSAPVDLGCGVCNSAVVVVDKDTVIALSASADANSVFVGWDLDCQGIDSQTSIVMNGSRHCAARFRDDSAEGFLLTVDADNGGQITSGGGGILGPDRIDCGETCSAIFREGSAVELTASADPGFEFTEWSSDCSGSNAQTTVTMDSRKFCQADFRAFELTVNVAGSGTVTSEPAGIDCGDTCSFAPGTGTVTLIATPALGWQFDGWGGNCQGVNNPFLLSMDSDKACTANFSRIPGMFILTVTTEGDGTVTSNPAGIDCAPDCAALFPAGSTVTLTAHPGAGQTLLTWFGDCQAPGDTVDILMESDKLCHAPFVDLDEPEFPLAQFTSTGVREVGQIQQFDGSASCVYDPDTASCDPAGIIRFLWDFNDDGTVEAAGDRDAAALAQFAYQSAGTYTVRLTVRGGNSGPNGTFGEHSDVLELNILENTVGLFDLSVSKTGDGDGVITSDPPGLIGCAAGCNLAGPVQLASGSQLSLVAAAEPGSSFGGWTGASCSSASANVLVDMLGNRSCTATFTRNRHTLSVVNNGNGRVFSNPAGIDCGVDCDEIYDEGTVITLTAIADAGFEFAGWTDCPVANANQCSITLNAPLEVTATFAANPSEFLLQVNKIGTGDGTVTSLNIPGIDCGADCSEVLPQGTLVGLQAVPDSGFAFIGWIGCDDADGDICSLSMNSDRMVTAEFQ